MAITACTTQTHENPFFNEWTDSYGIPPFDKIQEEDYLPAIEEGIKQQQSEIDDIIANKDKPSFVNTIEQFELSGNILSKVCGVLFNITETDRNPKLDSIVDVAISKITEHQSGIFFNAKFFEKVKSVYNDDQSELNEEQKSILHKLYQRFVHNGVGLEKDKQDSLLAINTELATKEQKISNCILAENNEFKKKFGIGISDYPNAMTSTHNREKREAMLKAYTSRGHNNNENDTRKLVEDIMRLRLRKANLLGYKNFAEYQLEDKMAQTPAIVDSFLAEIMGIAVEKAKEELADMQMMMDEDIKKGNLPNGTKIQPWDWWYYAEKVRRQKYNLDEEQIKPYFKLSNVVKGIFYTAKKLYDINIDTLDNVPSYNKDCVTTYKVTDKDGTLLGIFTTDYLPRESKRGGAWMNNIREQYVSKNGEMVRPIIVNVGNLEEFLTVDETQTVFHEFGHALHGLLSQCHYPDISGTNVKRDFVEMFSQFNENWAYQPEILSHYAFHFKTNEVIPTDLVNKITNSLKFNQGFMVTELCAASILDMKWHELENADDIDIDQFEKQVINAMGLIPEIGPRYHTTYFNHIFSSGYCAGYYGYLWAEVLDKDAFSIFKSSGNVCNKELATKFKKTFLEKGGSEDPMILFTSFAGRKPNSDAFFKSRGLK